MRHLCAIVRTDHEVQPASSHGTIAPTRPTKTRPISTSKNDELRPYVSKDHGHDDNYSRSTSLALMAVFSHSPVER